MDSDIDVDSKDFDQEYKINYPATLETQIRSLRKSVEAWKELVIPVYRILLWEKQWHPTAIFGGCTVLFMLVWLFDVSLLTVLASVGLIATLADYLVPSILSSVVKYEKWTNKKETILEGICADIILYKSKFEVACATYYRMRITNPKLYFAITVIALSLLAWIGNNFNNLLLMYVTTTTLLLLPGMEHKGVNRQIKSSIVNIFKAKSSIKDD